MSAVTGTTYDKKDLNFKDLKIFRPNNLYNHIEIETYKILYDLLTKLKQMDLNITTVESLTGGMIAKMLVDIPAFGPYIYGGFIVNDSDAKRMYLGVNTPDVYTAETAKQMAEGALNKSRTMVALAVTGKAGPYIKTDKPNALGRVHFGVSIRATAGYHTETVEYDAKTEKIFENEGHFVNYDVLDRSIYELGENKGNCPAVLGDCTTLTTSSYARDLIRLLTVLRACEFAFHVLINYERDVIIRMGKLDLSKMDDWKETKQYYQRLQNMHYDGLFNDCGEPTDVIEHHLETEPRKLYTPRNKEYNGYSTQKDCPPEINDYNLMQDGKVAVNNIIKYGELQPFEQAPSQKGGDNYYNDKYLKMKKKYITRKNQLIHP